ncbi:EAL domain-containing protein [Bacillus sp. SCS-153A]|uniref:EAL domain-containing protein n=1 Tax=Rossellomorea sedimentorum TaxID=3115294 RepID=UPI003906696E
MTTKCKTEAPLGYKFHHEFQPLWDLQNWKIYGYEGFFRSEGRNPEEIFSQARKLNYLFELDTSSIQKAIINFPFWESHHLFLNIYPSTLLHKDWRGFFKGLISKNPRIIGQLILELNETQEEERTWDIPELQKEIIWLTQLGFSIALDDVGKGAASLQKIVEFQPSVVKLDRYFSRELSESVQKQKLVSLLSEYCLEEGILLVMEGIETEIDLALSKKLKVSVGQGYLLGRPGPL